MRIDQYIAQRDGLSRNRVQQMILAGLIYVDGMVVSKASTEVDDATNITIVADKSISWVSRSAAKLDGFLNHHPDIIIEGSYCLDVGSSTGGFTQVLIERGARHVDAVDVGRDQLHHSLQGHPKISSYEQTDIRDFITHVDTYNIIVCDASFISLHDIIDCVFDFAGVQTHMILLFKPQFEVGKSNLRKTGIPKTQASVDCAKSNFEQMLSQKYARIICVEPSALKGEAGNQEWIYWIQKMQ